MESITSVAPNRRAASSRFGWMSITTIRDAPAMRAPLTALRPTPPAPKITTVSPACTFAVFKTEPAPVTTPQPSSAAWAKGMSFGTTASWFSWMSALFGEAAQPEALEQAGRRRGSDAGLRPVGAALTSGMLALEGAAGQASSARSARLRERTHDVIADVELRDVGADLRRRSRRPRDQALPVSERNCAWQRADRCDTARTLAHQ